MNKRIKQLLNEATSGHVQETDRSKVMTVSDGEMEMFAELILKECLSYIHDAAGDIDYVKFLINRNFGIKE